MSGTLGKTNKDMDSGSGQDSQSSPPMPKERFVLKQVSTAVGIFLWGILLGAVYALSMFDDPDFISIKVVFGLAGIYALPALTILVIIGLIVHTRKAQKIIYWITVGIFVVAGIFAAYLVAVLSDPNLE